MKQLGSILGSTTKAEIKTMVESAPPLAEGSGLLNIGSKEFYVWNYGDGKFGTQGVGDAVSGTDTNSTGIAEYLYGYAGTLLGRETRREVSRS